MPMRRSGQLSHRRHVEVEVAHVTIDTEKLEPSRTISKCKMSLRETNELRNSPIFHVQRAWHWRTTSTTGAPTLRALSIW